MIRIGLWNIDHPEHYSNVTQRNRRFDEISKYLSQQDCDVYVLTETNAAISLDGYQANFSAESPFRSKTRCYTFPNRYHQVGIHDQLSCSKAEIAEPVNGLLCKYNFHDTPLCIYGNVVTIKDRWLQNSNTTYSNRLQEQLDILKQLATYQCIVAGDFNLRLGWPQKKRAYEQVKAFVDEHEWAWPTEKRTDTVQHVLHSPDLVVDNITLDASVKHTRGTKNGLSDHPFISVELQNNVACDRPTKNSL